MKIFVDTSSLVKLYHKEADTYIIENIFLQNKVKDVFLSEVSKLEFISTIWKKVRTKEINDAQAKQIIEFFEKDFAKYIFVRFDRVILEQALILLAKYGKQGLRTLDGIQLSVALSLINKADLYITSDKLLKTFFSLESLPI